MIHNIGLSKPLTVLSPVYFSTTYEAASKFYGAFFLIITRGSEKKYLGGFAFFGEALLINPAKNTSN
jgi:hypothetical protein